MIELPTLAQAILSGDSAALAHYLDDGGDPNAVLPDRGDGERCSLLRLAVDASQNQRAMIDLLLRAGANPYALFPRPTPAKPYRCIHAMAYARELGKGELADCIMTVATECGPRWHREALQRRFARIRVWYDKAFGFQIDLMNWRTPILYGGDYDGAYLLKPMDALRSLGSDLGRPGFKERLDHLVPLLDRMISDPDLSLDEMLRLARGEVELLREPEFQPEA
jgi:hypothetical protein